MLLTILWSQGLPKIHLTLQEKKYLVQDITREVLDDVLVWHHDLVLVVVLCFRKTPSPRKEVLVRVHEPPHEETLPSPSLPIHSHC